MWKGLCTAHLTRSSLHWRDEGVWGGKSAGRLAFNVFMEMICCLGGVEVFLFVDPDTERKE